MKYLLVLLTLGGCSTLQIPEKVLVPVPTPCVNQLPDKPALKTHDELKSLKNADFIKQLALELFKYEEYTPKLEALVAGCAK